MRRRASDETPSFATEAIASAEVNGSQLAASGGLFIVLLIVMSLIEAPIPRWDASMSKHEDKSILLVGSPHPYGSASDPDVELVAEPSSKTVAWAEPRCLTSPRLELLSTMPAGAAHPPAG